MGENKENKEVQFAKGFQLMASQILPEYDRLLDFAASQEITIKSLNEEIAKQIIKINELSKPKDKEE